MINIDLWQHQKTMVDFAVDKLRDSGYAWWIAGCRIGKTLSALAVSQELHASRTLVITKKAAILSAWRADIQNYVVGVDYLLVDDKIHSNYETTKKLNVKQKTAYLLDCMDGGKPVIVVINYESAMRMAEALGKMGFDLVIADESHALKSHKSKTSKLLAYHLSGVPYKLNMTGTAWDDRPTDVYGQVRFLANDGTRHARSTHLGNWSQFFDKHVNYYMNGYQKIPVKRNPYKRLKELGSLVNEFTMYARTEDVLTLPPVRHIEYKLAMPPAMKKAYKAMEEDMVVEFGDDLLIASIVLTQGLRLHELTSGYYRNEAGEVVNYLEAKDNPKLQQLISILDEVGGEPIVVFTRFKKDVEMITTALKDLDISYKQLTGDVKEHVEWQEEATAQVLVANISAGGTGVTLSRARYVVYFSMGHNRTDYEQSLWRVRDANSDVTKPVVYHHLLMDKSIDVEIRKAMEGKEDVSTYLLSSLKNRLDSQG